jgi:hypothetical protein
MVAGVILVARAPVFRDLRLRELPHAAIERLQYPPPDYLDDAATSDAPVEATDDLATANSSSLVRPTVAESPGDAALAGDREGPEPDGKAVSPSAQRTLTE